MTIGRDLLLAQLKPTPTRIATLANGVRVRSVGGTAGRVSVAKANKLLVFHGEREGENKSDLLACLTRQKSKMRVEWMSAALE